MSKIIKIINYIKFPLAIFFAAIILIGFAIYGYNSVLSEEVHRNAALEVDEIQAQLKLYLENELDETQDDLAIFASYLAKTETTRDGVIEFLNAQSQTEEFDELYFISPDGEGLAKDGSKKDFSSNETFNEAMNNNSVISLPYVEGGTSYLDIAAPAIKNGEVCGIMMTQVSLDGFYQLISDLISEGDNAYIYDESNSLIITTDADIDFSHQMPYPAFMGILDYELINEQIENGISGTQSYVVDGITRVVIYTPLEFISWTLMINVSESSVSGGLIAAMNATTYLSIIIFSVLCILSVYTWYSRITLINSIEKAAYYDALTKLPNLAKLKKDMAYTLSRNKDKKYAVVKIDIDNFKAINEIYSFEVGDRVLMAFKTVKEMQDEPGLIVARTGVDEFIIFASDEFLQNFDETRVIYEEQLDSLLPQLSNHKLTFIYGRYSIEPGETDVDAIVSKVNLAHKLAKESKSEVVFDYSASFKEELREETELTNNMRLAIENNEFKVFLQPKFSVVDGQIIGAEALVRWIKDDGSMVFPSKFIPLFEKNGLIVELDEHVFELTCIVIRKWINSGVGHLPVSVNCSRLNLFNPNYAGVLAKIADKYNIPHDYLDIELTESTMIDGEELLEKLFTDLHNLNFKVSIDDFGSGLSSLGLLKNLNVDTLKLDKSFFHNSKYTVRSDIIVEGIVKIAQSLNMYVVAEGVETEEQLEFLKIINCDAVQGYYYEKPLPVSEFELKYENVMPKALQEYKKRDMFYGDKKGVSSEKFDHIFSVLQSLSAPACIFNSSLTKFKCNESMLKAFKLNSSDLWTGEFLELSPSYNENTSKKLDLKAIIYGDNKTVNYTHVSSEGIETACEITVSKLHILDSDNSELYVLLLKVIE